MKSVVISRVSSSIIESGVANPALYFLPGTVIAGYCILWLSSHCSFCCCTSLCLSNPPADVSIDIWVLSSVLTYCSICIPRGSISRVANCLDDTNVFHCLLYIFLLCDLVVLGVCPNSVVYLVLKSVRTPSISMNILNWVVM